MASARHISNRPKLAATLLRQEPLTGTQTQLTLNFAHTKQPLHLINNENHQTGAYLERATRIGHLAEPMISAAFDSGTEIGNDISAEQITATNQQHQANDLSLVYGISSWALVDELSLSSNVITQFECLLVIDGVVGYEQRQSLALQRGK